MFLKVYQIFILVTFCFFSLPCFNILAQDESPKDIIATQIRKQGFPCEKALTAMREQDESRADSPVWILTCEDQKYRVRLTPGMAAAVEKIN